MDRIILTSRILPSLAVAVCALLPAATAQSAGDNEVLQAYLARVAELNREGRSLVQEHGKDYLIGEYQALIEAHPDYEKNIQLETRIGEIYEWDYSNRGEPPDIESAYAVYLGIIARYNTDYEYTKLVYRRAADHAENLDLAAARELYAGMMEAYPDDPVVQLESLYRLGALAEREGDLNEARELFDIVLRYNAADQALNPDEAERIGLLQAQAASLLMALTIDPAATPEQRLAALDAFLDDNPDMLDEHGDIVEDFQSAMNRLKEQAPRDEVREAMAELQSLLAARQEARAMLDAPTGEGAEALSPVTGQARATRLDAARRARTDSAPENANAAVAGANSTAGHSAGANAFARFETDPNSASGEGVSNVNNRAAAMVAAAVCALLAGAGLFALRKRFGL